ncbi:ABC transporter substrate-binding protein [Kitasatospora sp. NPDC057223]|uniref:ABC transporter substrate-binding protein n=1 Tax=Kitasatospora sp. NPDC057223 TaxID=3346055 RepID=UPI0036412A5E
MPAAGPRPARLAAALAVLALAAPVLTACGSTGAAGDAAPASAATAALPTAVPAGTELRVGDQNDLLQTLLSASGQDKDLPYKLTYGKFQGGPAILEAFRGGSLDVGIVAETPAIFAQAAKQDVKVVGVVQSSKDAVHLVTSPGSTAQKVADLKGKKIAYTQGTTFQPALLKALKNAGLTPADVTLVNLTPLDTPAALASGQVDAGVVTEPLGTKYLVANKDKGAHELADDKGLNSGLQFLVAPGAALRDEARTAALRDLSARFTRAELWLAGHQQEWVQAYFVGVQKLPQEVGEAVVANNGKPTVPDYATAVAQQQQVADLLAEAHAIPEKLDVSAEFDTRFDAVQQAARNAG